MNKEEYIKYVKENEEMGRFIEIASQLSTILHILINSKLCTQEEYNKLKQLYAEEIIEKKYSEENPEDLENAKKIIDFINVFKSKGE